MTDTENKTNEDGFTLVEVMVTLVIIGLLTTFVVLNVLPAQGKAQVQKAKGDIAAIETALEMYALDLNNYPTEQEGLEALTTAPAGISEARYRQGGYIRKMSLDPWGNPYEYRNPGENGPIDIYSLGADGEPGGEGQDADIGNWQ
ncbi:type II secretion system major pseudopilin GspG [Litorimonas sp. WD9-15]|uniref:type II secretion system major pseudopilin GspG n=1 Tax=Litorimonas sp. WD9-15 TaxID=3418716 RepID=UPI003CFC53B9